MSSEHITIVSGVNDDNVMNRCYECDDEVDHCLSKPLANIVSFVKNQLGSRGKAPSLHPLEPSVEPQAYTPATAHRKDIDAASKTLPKLKVEGV